MCTVMNSKMFLLLQSQERVTFGARGVIQGKLKTVRLAAPKSGRPSPIPNPEITIRWPSRAHLLYMNCGGFNGQLVNHPISHEIRSSRWAVWFEVRQTAGVEVSSRKLALRASSVMMRKGYRNRFMKHHTRRKARTP